MANRKVNTKQDFVDDGVSWNTVTENENYLPVQYYDARRRTGELEPEKRMILAMIEQALDDYKRHKSHVERCEICLKHYEGYRLNPCKYGNLYWDAHDWIFEPVVEPIAILSFAWACQMFNIEPSAMQKGLENWKPQRRSPVGRRVMVAA